MRTIIHKDVILEANKNLSSIIGEELKSMMRIASKANGVTKKASNMFFLWTIIQRSLVLRKKESKIDYI